jgi:hypothetical protein
LAGAKKAFSLLENAFWAFLLASLPNRPGRNQNPTGCRFTRNLAFIEQNSERLIKPGRTCDDISTGNDKIEGHRYGQFEHKNI